MAHEQYSAAHEQSAVATWYRDRRAEVRALTTFVQAAAVLLVGLATASGSGEEAIEAGRIHERGFVLATPPGRDAAAGGDFDGDGYDDFVATWVNPSPSGELDLHEAFALLVYGGDWPSGTYELAEVRSQSVLFSLGLPKLPLRVRAAFLGDLDGDGRSELSLSFPIWNDADPEVSYIIFGHEGLSGDVRVATTDLATVAITTTDTSIDRVGWTVASVGDVNGDGRTDIALSSPSQGQAALGLGFVFVLYGPEEWERTVNLAEVGKSVPGFVLRGRMEDVPATEFVPWAARLGDGIQASGDVNGDGFDDFCITGGSRVYIVLGSHERNALVDLALDDPEGVIEIRGARKRDLFTEVAFPFSTTQGVSVGDLNGDGLDDFLLTLLVKHFLAWDHQVVLIFGRRDFPAKIDLAEPFPFPSVTFHSRDAPGLDRDEFGGHLAAAADVNQDGLPDLLIGAWGTAVNGRSSTGRAYLVYGKSDWGDEEVFLSQGFDGIRVSGEELWDAFGSIVEPAGDFNGDGNPDVLFVAPSGRPAPNPEKARRFYVLFGRGSGDVDLALHAVEPAWARARGGADVVIRGSGFVEGVTVLFGEEPAEIVEVSPTSIRVLVPPGLAQSTVDVMVAMGEQRETLSSGFEYTPDFPDLSLDPAQGLGFALVTPDPYDRTITAIRHAAFLDLDGDGADELAIGVRGEPSGLESPRWAVTIVAGGSRRTGEIPLGDAQEGVLVLTTRSQDMTAGATLGALGDIDGDGLEDLGIGVSATRGYVLFGRQAVQWERVFIEDEIAARRAVEIRGLPESDISFQTRFAALGDLTGDGIAELAMSQPGRLAGPEFSPGELVFVRGRARSEWPALLTVEAESGEGKRIVGSLDQGSLGQEFKSAGDVDGDGRLDLLALVTEGFGTIYVIFGRSWDDMAATSEITALVRSGSAVAYTLRDGISRHPFLSVAAPGDVNGDGYADFLAGALGGGVVHSIFTGFNYLFLGSPRLEGGQVFEQSDGPAEGIVRIAGDIARMQTANVNPVGDYNADGFADFLVSSSGTFTETGPIPPASFYLMFGREDLPERIELGDLGSWGLRVENLTRPNQLGPILTSPGDLDGDGVDDLVIAENSGRVDPLNVDELHPGRVTVIYGQSEAPHFVRGDCDGDGQVSGSVTDVVSLLTFAFAGGDTPPCLSACDVDDNGAVEGTTDAVYLLSYNFLGGEPPPSPFPGCGTGRGTSDALGCDSYPRCGR